MRDANGKFLTLGMFLSTSCADFFNIVQKGGRVKPMLKKIQIS